jgi:cyclopropane fatty-acyl-phospholipid synthase-like methyltransferase
LECDKSTFVKNGASGSTASGNETYGRALPELVAQVVELTGLRKGEKFVDVGSGVGQVVFHVALAVGCESIGIEIVEGRHSWALQLKESLIDVLGTRAKSAESAAEWFETYDLVDC